MTSIIIVGIVLAHMLAFVNCLLAMSDAIDNVDKFCSIGKVYQYLPPASKSSSFKGYKIYQERSMCMCLLLQAASKSKAEREIWFQINHWKRLKHNICCCFCCYFLLNQSNLIIEWLGSNCIWHKKIDIYYTLVSVEKEKRSQVRIET